MKLLLVHLAFILCGLCARAVDLTGSWKAEFSTQVGLQKYLYTFKQDGATLSGKAASEFAGQKREVVLSDVTLSGDKLTFAESFSFDGNEVRITYTGRVAENEIKFTREVGEFATEELVAKREKTEAPAAAAPPPLPRPSDLMRAPIVLGPDDKPAFPDPPAGFDKKREGVPSGKVELVEYDSTTVGTRRKMLVYTPPGYSPEQKYPVIYLLHGIGGDETEWQRFVRPEIILDNLIADKALQPVIAVFPNGRAQPNDRAEGDIFRHAKAFETFTGDLIKDIIPFIESRYAALSGREHRVLAGYSMGGGQSLNIGLSHLDTFAWIGAFSPAPNTRPPAQLVPNPEETTRRLKLLWLSCGNRDGLINFAQRTHAYLKEKEVPHIWHVDGNGHDSQEWKSNLYLFCQRLFR